VSPGVVEDALHVIEAIRRAAAEGARGRGRADSGIQIYPGVEIGDGAVLEPPLVLGKPPRGGEPGELRPRDRPGRVIRPFTTIYAGTTIGDRFQSGQVPRSARTTSWATTCRSGTNAVLEFGNRVGNQRPHPLRLLPRDGHRRGTSCFLGRTWSSHRRPAPHGVPALQGVRVAAPRCARWRRSARTRRSLPGVVIRSRLADRRADPS
jgi:hypothetical protein